MIKQITPEAPDLPAHALSEMSGEAIVDGAACEGVRLSGIHQTPIAARRVVLESSRIEGSVLVGSTLPSVRLLDCVCERADLSQATWTDARLVRTRFNECKLTGFDARGGELRDVVFDGCKMPESFLIEASLTRVRFDKCQLGGLDLSGAKLESVAIHNCDARSLRLIGAKIELLDLRGSMIEGLAIEPGAFRGIVIEPTQAPALAKAIGVRVIELDH